MQNIRNVGNQPISQVIPIQYNIADLVLVLRAGETKIREWIDKKMLIAYKIDGKVFVKATDVDWPKNEDTASARYTEDRAKTQGTFVDGATVGELKVLARAFRSTGDDHDKTEEQIWTKSSRSAGLRRHL